MMIAVRHHPHVPHSLARRSLPLPHATSLRLLTPGLCQVASTAEPRVTIPSQDLTGLDLLLHHTRSRNTTQGSRHASSSSRHNLHHQLHSAVRGGKADGGAAPDAAAHSAFASAESFPKHTAEDLSSAAEAPPNPDHHPATQPALSRLLAPPFNNAELRGDFIASLERHLAEYGDGGNKPEVDTDDVPGDNREASCAEDAYVEEPQRGGRNSRDGDGNGEDEKARHDCGGGGGGGGGDDCGGAPNDDARGKGNGDGIVDSSSLLSTAHAVREMQVGERAGKSVPRRALETAVVGTFEPRYTSVGEEETPNAEVEDDSACGVGGKVQDQDEDGKEQAGVLQEATDDNTSSKAGKGGSSTWAQEYHDYLCSKDP